MAARITTTSTTTSRSKPTQRTGGAFLLESGERGERAPARGLVQSVILAHDIGLGPARIGVHGKAEALRDRFAEIEGLALVRHLVQLVLGQFDLLFFPARIGVRIGGDEAQGDRLLDTVGESLPRNRAGLIEPRGQSSLGRDRFAITIEPDGRRQVVDGG